MATEENLIPFNERSEEDQRRIRSMGGKKSGVVRREQKLMSQIILRFLDKTPDAIFDEALVGCLKNKDSSSVQVMKMIHEATEGKKIKKVVDLDEDKNLLEELLK